jgi:hypothetical protein
METPLDRPVGPRRGDPRLLPGRGPSARAARSARAAGRGDAHHHALRVAVVSAGGRISFGRCADADAVDGLDLIAAGIERELQALGGAVGGTRAGWPAGANARSRSPTTESEARALEP